MNKDDAIALINHYVFDGEKKHLLEKLAAYPERYVGRFRPTKPKAKLIQNLLQSHEIRFGDALEYLIRDLITEIGFNNLSRDIKSREDENLAMDQFFTDGRKYILIEQKIRDDHDSTKKRGQIANFNAKIYQLYKKYGDDMIGIIYFIDPSLSKNRNFYSTEIEKLRKFINIEIHLFYGKELFDYFSRPDLWEKLTGWIEEWKANLVEFPEIDFDLDPEGSLEEIKTMGIVYWRRIIETESIWNDGIIRVLFSSGSTLKLLFGYFSQQKSSDYQRITKLLLERINRYYY